MSLTFSKGLMTSIGRKFLVGLTGAILFGFVIGHLTGNLLIYLGQDALNSYAMTLKSLGALLWVARGVLLVAVVTHIVLVIQLALENKKARPVNYAYEKTVQASLASRTMKMSGVILLVFILFHLAHFTFVLINPEFAELRDSLGRHDVYSMVVLGFSNVPVALFYIVSMVLLGWHLFHGSQSMAQSMGLNYPRVRRLASVGGPLIAALIVFGNISFPIAILLGLIRLP